MPHQSNRTKDGLDLSILGGDSAQTLDQSLPQPTDTVGGRFGLGVQQAQQQQTGLDLSILGAPSDQTLTPSTPNESPVREDGGLLQEIGEVLGDIATLATPTQPADRSQIAFDIAERVPEMFVRAVGVGAPALPAGIERGIRAGIEKATGEPVGDRLQIGDLEISTKPFEEIVAAGESAQQWVREFFGNDESQLVDLTGDIVGGYVTADKLFRSASFVNKFISKRFAPALFRPITAGQAEATSLARLSAAEQRIWANLVGGSLDDAQTIAAQAGRLGGRAEALARTALAGGEGAAFMAGLPDTDQAEIILGGVAGIGLQGGAEIGVRLAQKAMRAFPEQSNLIRQVARGKQTDFEIPGFPEFLAKQEANARLGAHFGQTSDEAVTSIRTALSDGGDSGAIGAARGLTDLDQQTLGRLREAYPNYRFEMLDDFGAPGEQTLVFGLRPGQKLPEGTRSAPSLTDKVVDDFRRTGLLRDQKVLVDGVEHRFLSGNVEGDNLLVKPLDQGKPYAVPRDRVAPLDHTEGLLENPRLLQQFRQFRQSQQLGFERAFDEFVDRFADDLPDALRPELRRYFAENEIKSLANRLRPDEAATLQRFRSARRRGIREGHDVSFETFAAQRGHVVHRLSDGRVKLTDMTTGNTTEPFRSPERAEEYLRGIDWKQPDVAPSIEDVPDELMNGVLMRSHRPNPSHAPKAQMEERRWTDWIKNFSPKRFADAIAEHASPIVTNMEDAARIMERRGLIDVPLWEDFMRPLSQDVRIVQNRMRPRAERLAKIFRGLDEAEEDLIKGWLRSERKETFETTHGMSERLITKAEQTRQWADDLFDELTASTGVDLDFDAYYRNYAPAWMDYQSQTGATDVVDFFRRSGTDESVPNEPAFFAEMWKSGEGQFLPQERLSAQLSRMLRSGMFKAYAGRNFSRAIEFANTLGEDNQLAKRHLIEYLEGMRGQGGAAISDLDKFSADIYRSFGVKANPADVRNLLDAMVDQTYGATIAFRPALVVRNMFQPQLIGGPILGHGRVFKAQVDALKSGVPDLGGEAPRDWARRIGIREEREAFQFFEDVGEDVAGGSWLRLNQRARSLGMKPYSGQDMHNRVSAGLAARRQAQGSVDRFLAGEISGTELFDSVGGLRVLDQPQRTALMNILEGNVTDFGRLGDTPREAALNFIADEVGSKLINFLYGTRNAAPQLRSSVGRAFGAYSTWPRGYLNWLTQITAADAPAGWKVKVLAKHGLAVSGVVAAGAQLGLNLSSWVSWNSLFFGGSPIVGVAKDVHTIWSGMPWERERVAAELAANVPRILLTGGQFITGDLRTSLERLHDNDPWGALAEAAGFRTLGAEDAEPAEAFRGLIPTPLQLPAQDAARIDFGGGSRGGGVFSPPEEGGGEPDVF